MYVEYSDDESDVEIEDNEGFIQMRNKAKMQNEPEYLKLFEKYKKIMPQKKAENKAERKMIDEDVDEFFDHYSQFLRLDIELRKSKLHRSILQEILEKIEKSISNKRAVSRVLAKHRNPFSALMDPSLNSEEEESEQESMETNSEEETEDETNEDEQNEDQTDETVEDGTETDGKEEPKERKRRRI